MKSMYVAPEVMVINMMELTEMLRCSCSADDSNPWR